MDYALRQIHPKDSLRRQEWLALLDKEGISADQHLDDTVGLYTPDGKLVATGSFYQNTLRCLAVDSAYRGEGLLNQVVSHLMAELAARGVYDLFLYTKKEAASFFGDLGFYSIARVDDQVVFMENSRTAFSRYLTKIEKGKRAGDRVGAIVMNANPFTLGHRYLIEQALKACDVLHLFVVREDVSAFPFAVRDRLIKAGTADLPQIAYHDTGHYIVSSATFPSYFIKESEQVTRAHARVDAAVFEKIARTLGITDRFVGDEPFSFATALYNEVLSQSLPPYGVNLHIIPRREDAGHTPISATRVRALLSEGRVEETRALLPQSTYDYLISDEGRALIQRIQGSLS